MLLSLQLVNLFWFFLILRILWRLVASWGEIDDVRSEDDESEVEQSEKKSALEIMRQEQGTLEEVEKPALFVNGVPVEGEGVDAVVANGEKR